MTRAFLRELAGFTACMIIGLPVIWYALKVYFGD
jgi:hypothetical protein